MCVCEDVVTTEFKMTAERTTKRTRKRTRKQTTTRAWSAYLYFTNERRPALVAAEPGLTPQDVMRRIGSDWRQLTDRSTYEQKALLAKEALRVPAVGQEALAQTPPAKDEDAHVLDSDSCRVESSDTKPSHTVRSTNV